VVIDLIGLLEDGAAQRAGAPTNARTTIRITKGEDFTIRLTVFDPARHLVTLSGGSLVMTAKTSSLDSQAAFSLVAEFAGVCATFTGTPATTKRLDPRRYVFDIWYTDVGHKRWPVVPLSTLLLEPTSTPVP